MEIAPLQKPHLTLKDRLSRLGYLQTTPGSGVDPVFRAQQLAGWVCDARQRTIDLVADLSDEQLLGPRLGNVNPLLWEIGHVAWFQEKWVLRHACGQAPIRADGDALYDSVAIDHSARWDLPLPSRADTLSYIREVRDRIAGRLEKQPTSQEAYFVLLSVFHEDMHAEAFTYTRQTLGYAPPRFQREQDVAYDDERRPGETISQGQLPGDVHIPGGTFLLGASRGEPFVFDNEKWEHPVEVKPFAISRTPVTQAEFARFVEDGGYGKRTLWSDAGWRWRESAGAQHPIYWRRESNGWQRRRFDQYVPLEPHHPVMHVNWHEARAYCRWADRRLPSEIEWEAAAAARFTADRSALPARKWRFPWGDDSPNARRANLDWFFQDCVDVATLPGGDSALGCRQMIGNVWEWTTSDFLPYPGFGPDPYKEYSEPWFGTHKVLRGGCWATRSRLLRNTLRSFYRPERRDVWAGFRTCAAEA